MHKSKIDGVKTFLRQQFGEAGAKPAEEGRPKTGKRDAFTGFVADQFSSGAKPRTSSGDAPPRQGGGIKAFLRRPTKGFSNAEVPGGASEGAVPHDQSTAASARAPEGAAPSIHQAQQAHHARQVQAHTSYTNAYTQLNDLKNQSQHIEQQLASLVSMGAISPEKAQQLKDNIVAGFGVINQDMSSAAEHLKSNPDFASRALSSAGVNAGTLRNQIYLANFEISQAQQNKFSEVNDKYIQLYAQSQAMDQRVDTMVNSGAMRPERAAELKESNHAGIRCVFESIEHAKRSMGSNVASTQNAISLAVQNVNILDGNLRHSMGEITVAKRQIIDGQKVHGQYVHMAGAKFPHLHAMDANYINEATGDVFGTSVKYLNREEREACKVTINNGLMYDASGKLFDTSSASSAFSHLNGRAIFVMDHNGNVYVSNYKAKGKFHHSSFLAGQPVAAAGYIHVENGVVKAALPVSGHYKPTETNMNQMLWNLYNQGISVPLDSRLS
jgi:hypothetical protein